ncbi:hypothetical protein ABFU82_22665 [Nocardioides sp. WV_118_6]
MAPSSERSQFGTEVPHAITRSDRTHDLPPAWDGLPVEWRGWIAAATTLSYHLPLEETACRRCGSLNEQLLNVGVIDHGPRGDARDPEEPRHHVRLFAFRCPDCRHDQVLDQDDDQLWDLDETDYGDDGSVPPDAVDEPPAARDIEPKTIQPDVTPVVERDVAGADQAHDGSLRDLPAPPLARSYCHGCGELIVWATTVAGPNGPGGKLQPFDPRENPVGRIAITQPVARGRLLARALHKGETVERPLEYIGMTHFATCRAGAHPAPPIALLEHQTRHLGRRGPGRRR